MKIIFYGSDGSAAKDRAAEVRKTREGAQVRSAPSFREYDVEECDGIIFMPDVNASDKQRISKAYGEVSEEKTPEPQPPAPIIPPAPPVEEPPAVNVNDMTDEELRALIEERTGMAVHGNAKRDTLIARASQVIDNGA